MKVISWDELAPEHEIGIAILRDRAFSEPDGTERIRRKIALGYPYSPYTALYAVDGPTVYAMIEVRRLRFTTRSGEETMGGLAYVATRQGVSRMGLARGLIAQALQREKAEGIDHVLLWTGRHLVAHALYEKMGFVDILSPPSAYRQVPRDVPPLPGYLVRHAEMSELPILEELHAKMALGRFGFTSRFPKALAAWVGSGMGALSQVHVLEREGAIVGYWLTPGTSPGAVMTWEIAVPWEEDRLPFLRSLEWFSRGNLLLVSAIPGSVWERLLRDRGYVLSRDSWGTLMAHKMGSSLTPSEMRHEMGTDDPGFLCQYLDNF